MKQMNRERGLVFKMVLVSVLITAPIIIIMTSYEVSTFIDKAALYLENTLLREKLRVHEKLSDLSELVDNAVSDIVNDLAAGRSVKKYDDVMRIEISARETPYEGKGFRITRKVIIGGKLYNLYMYINPSVMRGIVKDRNGNIRILIVDPKGEVVLPQELSGKKLVLQRAPLAGIRLEKFTDLLEKYDIKFGRIGDVKYYLMNFQSPIFSGYKVYIVMDYQRTLSIVERNLILAFLIDSAIVFGIGLMVFIYVSNLTFPVQKIIDQLRDRKMRESYDEIEVDPRIGELRDMVLIINELLSNIKKNLEEAKERERILSALHEKVSIAKDRLVKIDSLISDLMMVDDKKSALEMAMMGIMRIFPEISNVCYEFESEEVGRETGGECGDGTPVIITVATEDGEYRFYIYGDVDLNEEQIGMLDIFFSIAAAIAENKNLWNQIEDSYFYLTQKLSEVSEVYDDETGKHIKRVGEYSALVAKELGMDKDYVEKIRMFSQLHDIGKLRVPREILTKPDKLTPEEVEVMKKHTIYGAEFLGEQPWLKMARNVALYHHENWDGTGYPFGLKEEEIPLEARIVKIADIYDALRSKRRYKPSFTHKETMRIILEGDGRTMPSHFDPQILEVFKRVHLKFNEIFELNRD